MRDVTPRLLSRRIGDSSIQYLLYEGGGRVMVLLHATGFLPWMWHPIARDLSDQYTLIAPYFCDHREFDPDEGGLSWITLADDLCELCIQLKLEKPLLVGHSMGATVMTIAEARNGPRAEAMIAIEPIFLPRDFYRQGIRVEDHPLASKSIKRRNVWDDGASAKEYLRSKSLFKKWDEEMLDLYIRHGMKERREGGLELSCSPRREASLFMGGIQNDPWPTLSGVHCPVLVVEGEESENRPFINLREIASLFPKGRYRLIEGAGHLIPMERPREISALIRGFFAEYAGS